MRPILPARARGVNMSMNKNATKGWRGSASSKLLAALAVLAVALVVLTAISAAMTESDAVDGNAAATAPGITVVAAGYIGENAAADANFANDLLSWIQKGEAKTQKDITTPVWFIIYKATGTNLKSASYSLAGASTTTSETLNLGGGTSKAGIFYGYIGNDVQKGTTGGVRDLYDGQLDEPFNPEQNYHADLKVVDEVNGIEVSYDTQVTIQGRGMTVYSDVDLGAQTYKLTQEGERLVIKAGAGFNGTVSFTDNGEVSTVKIEKVRAAADSFITAAKADDGAGCIDMQGSLSASANTGSKITATGMVRADGEMKLNGAVVLDTKAAKSFIINRSSELVLNDGASIDSTGANLVINPSSRYVGPALVDQNNKLILDIPYTEGSSLIYRGNTYTVYSKNVGTIDGDTKLLRFMVSDVTVEYTGEPIRDRDISKEGIMTVSLTGNANLTTTVGYASFNLDTDYIAKHGDVVEPGNYNEAVHANLTWTYTPTGLDTQSGILEVWIDIKVSKIDISKFAASGLEITANDVSYTGSDLSGSVKFAIPGKNGQILDQANCLVVFSPDNTASKAGVVSDNKFSAVGGYKATLTVKDTDKYFTGTYDGVKFKVVPAKAVITLNPSDRNNNITAEWNSEQYRDKTVWSEITMPSGGDILAADMGNITIIGSTALRDGRIDLVTPGVTTHNSTEVVGATDTQALVDGFMKLWTADDGIVFYVQVNMAASTNGNIGASESAVYKVTVNRFIPIEDYVKFDVVTPAADVTLIQDKDNAFHYTANGVLSMENGRYFLEIRAQSIIPTKISLKHVTGNPTDHGDTTVAASSDKIELNDTNNPTNNDGANNILIRVYIGEELSTDSTITVSVKSTRQNVCTDAVYTIDLSGLAPQLFSIRLVENGFATLVFTNYIDRGDQRLAINRDGTAGDPAATQADTEIVASYADGRLYFTNGSMFPLPATATNTLWKLESSGITYQAGSVYTVAAKDIKGGVITFNAAGGSSQPVGPDQPASNEYTVFYVVGTEVSREVVAADKALTFPTVEGRTVTWYLNGQALASTEDVTVTSDTTYVGVVQAEASVYSKDVAVNAKLDDGKIRFVIAGYDGGDIMDGSVSISYTYTSENGGRNRTGTIASSDITVVHDGNVVYGVVDMPAGQNVVRFSATYAYELDGQSYSVSSSIVYVGA